MKKILQTLIFFCIGIISSRAQTLVGATQFGGTNGAGAIVKYEVQPNVLTLPASFEGENLGGNPVYTILLEAGDGKFYGMSSSGGTNNRGTIFSFDPSTSSLTTLKNFLENEGAAPFGSLIQATNGKLYGVTPEGGTGAPGGAGVIFSFDQSTSTYTKLHDFDLVNGGIPQASLVQASDGKLYGTTAYGGSTNNGIIYSYDPGTSTFTRLFDFADVNSGQRPYGAMVQGDDGKLYGTTSEGGLGANDNGTIFSYDPSTGTYMTLISLTGANGRNPLGNLLKALDGKFYGTTLFGGSNDLGTIFSFDPFTTTYVKLHDFNGDEGSWASASLIQASDGRLYGMTRRGGVLGKNEDGTTGAGTIFSFDVATSMLTKLKDFDNVSGSNPEGGLFEASDGKLYGMTRFGGANFVENLQLGSGVIYSLEPETSTFTKLKDFSASNGGRPSVACSSKQWKTVWVDQSWGKS